MHAGRFALERAGREQREPDHSIGATDLTKEEVLSLIDLLERVRLPAERQFKLTEPDPLWNMTVYLVKRHLTGMLVTPTVARPCR